MTTPSIELLDLRGHDRPELLRAFTTLYLDTFTDPAEREDPGQWSWRLKNSQPAPHPRTHLLVAFQPGDGAPPTVFGGLVFEFYPASRCGLLTYLVVDSGHRRRGLAKRLVAAATEILRRDAQELGGGLRGIFAEAEDPAKVAPEHSSIPPRERLAALTRLGGRWVDVPYVQPALGGGGGRCHHLLLLAFDPDGRQCGSIAGQTVRDFLYEFYQALGVDRPEADADFLALSRRLGASLPLQPYPSAGTTK